MFNKVNNELKSSNTYPLEYSIYEQSIKYFNDINNNDINVTLIIHPHI